MLCRKNMATLGQKSEQLILTWAIIRVKFDWASALLNRSLPTCQTILDLAKTPEHPQSKPVFNAILKEKAHCGKVPIESKGNINTLMFTGKVPTEKKFFFDFPFGSE